MSDLKQEGTDGRTVVLGLQHVFVMFGATVLVPLLTGIDVGVTLFAAGIGTWLFHILTKFNLPVFLGSSFAFLPPHATGPVVIAIILAFIHKFTSIVAAMMVLGPGTAAARMQKTEIGDNQTRARSLNGPFLSGAMHHGKPVYCVRGMS